MPDLFCDHLLDAIDYTHAPICVGIDPILESLPDAVRGKYQSSEDDTEAAIDAIFDFTAKVLKIVAPHVPIVKFQSAYFEKYLWEGVEAYYSLVQEAKDLNLLVIGDVKRGDIGSTATAYAAGHLANQTSGVEEEVVTPDAITVNPMLGMDTLAPFVQTAHDAGKGLFVLVRTSNPGSAELQDAPLAAGGTWAEMLADKLREVAAGKGLVGSRGYSSMARLSAQPSRTQWLVSASACPSPSFYCPAMAHNGETAEMTRAAFKNGTGAIVSASRSILYAHNEPKYSSQFGKNWEKCVEAAVLDMKRDIAQVLELV